MLTDPFSPADAAQPAPLTVSQLNALSRDLLESQFAAVAVEGELSGLSRPSSGHWYFTLKDARAQIRCALFRQQAIRVGFQPADGDRVVLHGRISLYEARGDYQLIGQRLERAGEGDLLREFLRLKAQLEAEGLFDVARKRPLPMPPQRLAVVTSPTGAAIRDVLTVLRRRWPLLEVDVVPVPVQGLAAPAAIIQALDKLERLGRHDAVLLTRGGGSLEDLAAFNDEALARRIAAFTLPIVAAVGHEVDFTIAEFVADMRAATPSAAAELLVPDIATRHELLGARSRQLDAALARVSQSAAQRLDHLERRLALTAPAARLAQRRQRLAELAQRLTRSAGGPQRVYATRLESLRRRLAARHIGRALPAWQQQSDALYVRLGGAWQRRTTKAAEAIRASARALHAVSPLATLDRGFAIVLANDGSVLPTAAAVRTAERFSIKLRDGTVPARLSE